MRTADPILIAALLVGLLAAPLGAQTPPVAGAKTKPATAAITPGAAPRVVPPSVPSAPLKMLEPRPDEAAYRARLQAALAPLLASPLSADGARALKEAIKTHQPALVQPSGDAIAAKLAQWQALKAGVGAPADFLAFVTANPAWPDSQMLLRRAEEQLFNSGGSATTIKAFFGQREPVSGAGWAALASAFLAEGDEATARRHAGRAWADEEMAASFETGFLERFGKLLTAADHKRRLNRLLVDRVKFKAQRRERAAIARRVIARLPADEQKVAQARLAVFLQESGAASQLAALPAAAKSAADWGLAYAHAEQLLREKKLDDAAKILTNLPTDPELLASPDDWWLARREAAFLAMKSGRGQLAYDLVKASGPLSINPLKEQLHMAGWTALVLLKQPDVALLHFDKALAAADGPLSRARSAYWSARALEALGRKADARKRYQLAVRDPDTFHALLARQRLDGGPRTDLKLAFPAVPTAAEVERFAGLDAVRAAIIARQAGLDRNLAVGLFAGLRNYLKTEGELALLAELAAMLGDPQTSLRVGKAAIARGLNLIVYAYPVDAFPVFTPLRTPPEMALLLAVARQETEFNTQIVSTAGARGLLQVMPVTARHVCSDYKIACDIPRLLTDHAYNAMMAAAYIGDRMRELDGWYAVALPAYNAGPGRARQWLRENGDPRTGAIATMDWMERIPIEETRQYVEKVLANIQIYRARLGEAKPLRLEEDLNQPTGLRRASR